jgi:glucose-6-phosphate 1-epimerase
MAFPHCTLATAAGRVEFSPYGAQVLRYVPTGQQDVLWPNTPELLAAAYAAGKPLRAGIPLCWPWFLKHPTEPTAPSHGFARTRMWDLVEQEQTAAAAWAKLELVTDGRDLGFPYLAKADVVIRLADVLRVELTTTNRGTTPLPLTQALHTYVRVGAIEQTTLAGLAGLPRVHITPNLPLPPHTGVLNFQAETELRYANVVGPLQVHDGAENRTVVIRNTGCTEAVVWNPWQAKAASLDMPPEDYRHLVCVEAANIQPVLQLAPGASHTLITELAAV